jgi:hypothetical protein
MSPGGLASPGMEQRQTPQVDWESGRVSRTHVPSTNEYGDGVLVHSCSGLRSVPDQLNQLTELLPCLHVNKVVVFSVLPSQQYA